VVTSDDVGSPWDQVAVQMWWDEARSYERPVSGLVAAAAECWLPLRRVMDQ
jgi:hypothetical protein